VAAEKFLRVPAEEPGGLPIHVDAAPVDGQPGSRSPPEIDRSIITAALPDRNGLKMNDAYGGGRSMNGITIGSNTHCRHGPV